MSIQSLPNEILYEILSRLDVASLNAAYEAHPHWACIIDDRRLWLPRIITLDEDEEGEVTKRLERLVGLPRADWPNADLSVLRSAVVEADARIRVLGEKWRREGPSCAWSKRFDASLLTDVCADLKAERVVVQERARLSLYDLTTGDLLKRHAYGPARVIDIKGDELLLVTYEGPPICIFDFASSPPSVTFSVDEPEDAWDDFDDVKAVFGRFGQLAWVKVDDPRVTFLRLDAARREVRDRKAFELDEDFEELPRTMNVPLNQLERDVHLKLDEERDRLFCLFSWNSRRTGQNASETVVLCFDLATGTETQRFEMSSKFVPRGIYGRETILFAKSFNDVDVDLAGYLDLKENPFSMHHLSGPGLRSFLAIPRGMRDSDDVRRYDMRRGLVIRGHVLFSPDPYPNVESALRAADAGLSTRFVSGVVGGGSVLAMSDFYSVVLFKYNSERYYLYVFDSFN